MDILLTLFITKHITCHWKYVFILDNHGHLNKCMHDNTHTHTHLNPEYDRLVSLSGNHYHHHGCYFFAYQSHYNHNNQWTMFLVMIDSDQTIGERKKLALIYRLIDDSHSQYIQI